MKMFYKFINLKQKLNQQNKINRLKVQNKIEKKKKKISPLKNDIISKLVAFLLNNHYLVRF